MPRTQLPSRVGLAHGRDKRCQQEKRKPTTLVPCVRLRGKQTLAPRHLRPMTPECRTEIVDQIERQFQKLQAELDAARWEGFQLRFERGQLSAGYLHVKEQLSVLAADVGRAGTLNDTHLALRRFHGAVLDTIFLPEMLGILRRFNRTLLDPM